MWNITDADIDAARNLTADEQQFVELARTQPQFAARLRAHQEDKTMTYGQAEFNRDRQHLEEVDSAIAAGSIKSDASTLAEYGQTLNRMNAFMATTGPRNGGEAATAGINRAFGSNADADQRTKPRDEQPVNRDSLALRTGEYALEYGRAQLGRAGNARYAQYADSEIGRVVAWGTSGDGTAPVTIEGDLVKFVDPIRYAVNASRLLPMPDNNAPTFKRPRATQLTTVAQQVTEGDVLSSQRLQLTGDTITKTTRGGVLGLSEQEIDWTDPAMLGLAITDLAESYAVATDTVLTAAIVAAAAANDANEQVLAAAQPTAAAFVAAIAGAAAQVYSTSKRFPDVIYADVNWWARIIQIVDLDGRPVFNLSGSTAFNAWGGNPGGTTSFDATVLGLKLVVDPTFAADTLIVGASSLVEFYEQNKGLLTINVPSTLSVEYAYRGYCAANCYSQGLGLIEAV